MSELVFYTHPQSRGRIAHWMLEEVGEPYDTVWLEYGSTMKAPEYLAVNPMGKVPALRDGDTVVTESAAICAYLADRFPQRAAGAAARRPGARGLLPLDVLRGRPAGDGHHRPRAGLAGARRAQPHGRLRLLCRCARRAGDGAAARAPTSAASSSPPPTWCWARRWAGA